MTDHRTPDSEILDDRMFEGWREADRHRVQQALRWLEAGALDGPPLDMTKHWTFVHSAIECETTGAQRRVGRGKMPGAPIVHSGGIRRARTHLVWVVATVLAVVGVGAAMLRHEFLENNGSRVYRTARAQSMSVRLADGSAIQIAPETKLTVDGSSLTLDGEAFVTAIPRSRRALTVRTTNAEVHVLGTQFLVRKYRDDVSSHVMVSEGRVNVRATIDADVDEDAGAMSHAQRYAHGTGVILSNGMSGQVTDSGSVIVNDAISSDDAAWTRGQLVFRDAAVPAVLTTLSRWYGYQFKLADSTIATRHLYATFKVSDAQDAFAELQRLLHVTLTVDGTVITLRPQPPRQFRAPIRQHVRDTALIQPEVGR